MKDKVKIAYNSYLAEKLYSQAHSFIEYSQMTVPRSALRETLNQAFSRVLTQGHLASQRADRTVGL